MTRVFEAERDDGTRQLVAPSVIRNIVETAKTYHHRRWFNYTGKMLANFMYCSRFIRLVAIDYNSAGQKRTEIISRKAA